MTAERSHEPDAHEKADAELHRLWSPEQLAELQDSRRRYAVGRRLAGLAADVMGKRLTDATIARRLRQLADWWERPGAERPTDTQLSPEKQQLIDDVQTVLGRWERLSGRKCRRGKATDRRRKMIADRLKDGHTVAELLLVVDFADQDEFWGGEKARRGEPIPIEGYMKSSTLVEDLLTRARADGHQPAMATDNDCDAEIEAMEDEAARLAREGKIDESNALQREIRNRISSGKSGSR